MEKKEEGNVVEWIRKVRDEHHRKYGHLPMDEFVRKVAEEGDETELARKFRAKKRKTGKK
jgi:hypothetical protein